MLGERWIRFSSVISLLRICVFIRRSTQASLTPPRLYLMPLTNKKLILRFTQNEFVNFCRALFTLCMNINILQSALIIAVNLAHQLVHFVTKLLRTRRKIRWDMSLNGFECYNFSATHNIIDKHIFGHKYDGSELNVWCDLIRSYGGLYAVFRLSSLSGHCYRIRNSKMAVVINVGHARCTEWHCESLVWHFVTVQRHLFVVSGSIAI